MNIEFFEKFLKTYRPSGFEKEGGEVFLEEVQKLPNVSYEFMDNMWNACVSIGSDRQDALKVLISGHSDQNCLIVTDITKNGFLKYATQGGISPRTVIDSDLFVIVDEDEGIFVVCFTEYKREEMVKKICDFNFDINNVVSNILNETYQNQRREY